MILALLLNDTMGNIVHLHACMEYECPNDLTGYGMLLFQMYADRVMTRLIRNLKCAVVSTVHNMYSLKS